MPFFKNLLRFHYLAGSILLLYLLGGCAQMASYNPQLVPSPGFTKSQKLDGKVLVFTEKIDDDTPFVGPPTSFTGGGTKLSIQLGVFTREIAGVVFGDLFSGGVTKSNVLTNDGFRLVIHPKVISYSYEYDQLKNLGFAVTPIANVSLDVRLLDNSGKVIRSRTYQSGPVEGPTYIVSGSPGEEIGKATHKAIYDLMLRVASDVRSDFSSQKIYEKGKDL